LGEQRFGQGVEALREESKRGSTTEDDEVRKLKK
jgi:hypothetical protein